MDLIKGGQGRSAKDVTFCAFVTAAALAALLMIGGCAVVERVFSPPPSGSKDIIR